MNADQTASASDDWWDDIVTSARRYAPFEDLVPGLDEVASLAIPYAHLPRRAFNAYAEDYTLWSDIRAQSVHSLLMRPKVGERTVRALLTAATDAVRRHRAPQTISPVGASAAVEQLLDRLDERDRVMLSTLVWATPPHPLHVVVERLETSVSALLRNRPRAQARLAELVADPAHHEVDRYVVELRNQLGSYLPAAAVTEALGRLEVPPDTEVARVLLHLAGPYVRRGDWVENTTADGQRRAASTVDAQFVRCPAPGHATLVDALDAVGMPAQWAAAYLASQPMLRRFGEVWVQWGDTQADKVEAVLHVLGTPTTAEDIVTKLAGAIPAGSPTLRAVHRLLSMDPRFIRATRTTWALPSWGIDEYSGIYDEIGARIDAAGGHVKVEQLIQDVLSRIPDVSQKSVRSYLSTKAFITEKGVARRRTGSDDWVAAPPLNTAFGAFRNGDNEIRLAIPVTVDMLRGSGLAIRPAVAAALGVRPDQERSFTGPCGPVVVLWRLSTIRGPATGSLRLHANAVGAKLADTLVLVFAPQTGTVHAERIGGDVTGMQRLPLLLGRRVRSAAAALATSLECPKSEVAELLRKRGDTDIADLIDL